MKHKTLRTLLCVILTVCFCLSAIVPASAAGLFGGDSGAATGWDQLIRGLKDRFIEKNPGTDETPAEPMAGTGADGFYRIVHLDCGRKYFSVENIKKLIDTMEQYGYNQLQLAFGNDGFRFLLDDMKVTFKDANGKDVTIDNDTMTANIKNGNVNYTGSKDEANKYLSQTNMDDIITYANRKGIEIVPMINMPGHMNALLYGQDDYKWSYNNSKYPNSLNIDDETARNYGYAILQKYVDYFKGKGCKYFNFGGDEFANAGQDYGVGTRNNNPAYYWFSNENWTDMQTYMNGCIDIIKNANLTARCYNDAILYNNNQNNCSGVDKSVEIYYWGNGWSGFSPASTSTLINSGYTNLINNNGAWYYVLKNENTVQKPSNHENYSSFNVNSFADGSNVNAKGAVFCIWCDNYDLITDDQVMSKDDANNALDQVIAMAKQLWNASGEPVEEEFTIATGSGTTPPATLKNGESVILTASTPATWTVSGGVALVSADTASADAVSTMAETNAVTATKVQVTATASSGTATITATSTADANKTATYTVTLTDANVDTVPVTVTVNGTTTINVNGTLEQASGNVVSGSGETVATYTVTNSTKRTRGDKVSSLSTTQSGVISDGTNYMVVSASGVISNTTDIEKASVFTVNSSSGQSGYSIATTVGSTTYYLRIAAPYGYYEISYSLSTTTQTSGISWSYDNNNGFYQHVSNSGWNRNRYLKYNNGWTLDTSGSSGNGLYYTTTSYISIITFTGLVVSTVPVLVTIGGTTYAVTVAEENLDNAPALPVELWITNQYIGATSETATETGHFVTLHASENGLYSVDGVDLATLVPDPGYQPSGSKTNTFWKGVVLHDGDKQYHANGTNSDKSDKSGKGDSFYKIRYYEGNWSYLVSGEWKNVKSTDTVIAYYLQDFTVSAEIETHTRDWGDAPTSAYKESRTNNTWNYMYTATCFSVVYPDYSLSRDENEMYANAMMRGHNGSADYDGLGAGKQSVGVVYAENNSDYKVSKITVVKANEINLDVTSDYYSGTTYSWPAADGTNNPIVWAKETNDAGQQWYSERIVWSADDPEMYGEVPMFVGARFNADGTPDLENSVFFDVNTDSAYYNKAYLILIYLEPVAKDENLNVVYWDDNAQTQINPKDIQIVVSEGTTFVNGLQNVEDAAAGATVTLPDNAYIVNSSGVQQKFNKDITILEGVAANYRSGIYEYRSADISTDGKTLTLHYNLKAVADKHTYVVDFGLPLTFTDILSSFFGIENASTVEYLSVAKSNKLTESTGSFGSVVIDTVGKTDGEGKPIPPYDTMTYTLDQKKTVSAPIYIPLYLKISGTTELRSTQIELIPASNVYYEETFTSTNANGNWSLVGTANDVEQTCDENVSGTPGGDIYGFDTNIHDSHYNKDASGNNTTLKALTYSNGQAYKATLSLPAGKKNVMTSATVDFTFKGTGFDLISECGNDTGILLVTIDSRSKTNGAANVSKGYLVDTYFCGDTNGTMSIGDYLWQVPVVRDLKLPYDTYDVKVYGIVTKSSGVAVGSVAETAALAMDISDGSTSDLIADILADCGISNLSVDDVEVIYMDENSVLNGGTGTASSDIIRDKVSIQSVAEINDVTYPVVANCYVDGFRVYGALGNTETVSVDAYTNDKENEVKYMSIWDAAAKSLMTGTYYVEYKGAVGTDTVAIADYKKNGPENEIYLAQGQSIAFAIDKWGKEYKFDVSAKVVKGSKPELNGTTPVNATEMYYSINPVQKGNIFIATLTNNTDGVLAVSGLKMSKDINIVQGDAATTAILEVLSGMYAVNAFNPETFDVSAPETARKNRNFTINATVTASDVAKLTIKVGDGEEAVLNPYNTMTVQNGYTDDYAYSKTYRFKKAGTYTFVVTAYDAAGNSVSLTRTVVVK